jgi:hypothetical protein
VVKALWLHPNKDTATYDTLDPGDACRYMRTITTGKGKVAFFVVHVTPAVHLYREPSNYLFVDGL